MEELQNTIQDAQYMGAMVDPTPRPTAVAPALKKRDELMEFEGLLMRHDKHALAPERVVESTMGFYFFKRFCNELDHGGLLRFLEEVNDFRLITQESSRREQAKTIFATFLADSATGHRTDAASLARHRKSYPVRTPGSCETEGSRILRAFYSEESFVKIKGEPVKNVRRAISDNSRGLSSSLFDEIEAGVFEYVKTRLWSSFVQSQWYSKYLSMLYVQGLPIRREDFALFRVIGRGGFGMVNGCKHSITGKLYAMKVLNKKMIKKKQAEKVVLNERKMLEMLDSPFIAGLKYAYSTKDDLYLILDLCTGGDLSFHLRNSGRFAEDRARFYAAQVLLGLEHMHSKGIVYRDLKPDNILLDAEGHCKVSDLGLATNEKSHLTGRCGTRGYWAPEVLARSDDGKRLSYTAMVDFWSYGCVLYEMISGVCPFRTARAKSLIPEDKQQSMDLATLEMEVEYDTQYFTLDARSILQGLLMRDPRKRLGAKGFSELKQHAFFFPVDWDRLEAFKLPPPFAPEKNINARSQGTIGAFDLPGKEVQITMEDEAQYAGWEYKSTKGFQEEIIELVEWEEQTASTTVTSRENGSCCTVS